NYESWAFRKNKTTFPQKWLSFERLSLQTMQELQQEIKNYEAEIRDFNPKNAAELEAFRIRFLGAKGIVKQVFGEMKNVPADQKKQAGQLLNAFKQLAESAFESFRYLQSADQSGQDTEDISLPATPFHPGVRHPLRKVENRMIAIFE